MILQALCSHYERLSEQGKVQKPGWSQAKVSYGLKLLPDGTLSGVHQLKNTEIRGKKEVQVPRALSVPQQVVRSSGVSPNFLCDTSSYILGIDNSGKPERTARCFQSSKEKHLHILENAEGSAARAVRNFYHIWDPEEAMHSEVLKDHLEDILKGTNLVFLCDGDSHDRFVHEDKEIIELWEQNSENSKSGEKGICMVTGKHSNIARIHTAVKGIPGAQSSGAALISFNAPAFESYGKKQSYNAPVSEYAAYAYTTALNYLIADKKHCCRLGDIIVVYWAESGESGYQDAFACMAEPTEDSEDILKGIFGNLSKGKKFEMDDNKSELSLNERFFVMGLSPNAARVSVRFFYQDFFGNIIRRFQEHFNHMEIVRPSWDKCRFPGIYSMVYETVNSKATKKEPVTNLADSVFRAILTGRDYPAVLYNATLGRIKSEQDNKEKRIQKITPTRAAIVKAYLIKNRKEDITVGLNEKNDNLAYVLGQEFAVLEEIQEAASHGLNTTIKDRYFNSACATPAMAFPTLFRLKNSHIRKLKAKGKKELGYAINCEKKLEALQAKISVMDEQNIAYPKRLSMDDQGMFILGYYHQNQKRFEKSSEKKAKIQEEREEE